MLSAPEMSLLGSTCPEDSHRVLEGEQQEGLKRRGEGRRRIESHATRGQEGQVLYLLVKAKSVGPRERPD